MANQGVGVRLYVAGGSEVRREFGQTADAGKRMWSEIATGQRQVHPGIKAVAQASSEVRDGISSVAAEAGAAGRVLSSMGLAGVAAAVAVGGLTIALGQAKAAMSLGDEIADAAAKIGVSTDTLQEYRYAVQQTGGAFTDADTALAAFTRALGAAESGLSPKVLKAFQALGFTKEQLKSFGSADEALHAVTAKISALGSEAERAAVADKLGLTPMLPLLREGADNMDALRQAAHELGFVMDADVIARMGEANDKFEAAALIVKTQFAQAFVDLVPVLVQVMQSIADLARQTNDFFDGFNKVQDRQRQSIVDRRGVLLAKMTQVSMNPSNLRADGSMAPAAKSRYDAAKAEYDALGIELTFRNGMPKITAPAGGGTSLDVPTRPGRAAKPKFNGTLLGADYAQLSYDPATGQTNRVRSANDWAYRDSMGFFPGEGPELAKSPQVDLNAKLDLPQLKPQLEQLQGEIQSTFSSGIRAAFEGNFGDWLKTRLRDAAYEGLAAGLAQALTKAAGSSSFLSSAVSWFTAGTTRHAAGGLALAGDVSSVGEQGLELAAFGRNGQIFSHEDTVRALRSAVQPSGAKPSVTVHFNPQIDARGAGPREVEQLRGEMNKMRADMPGLIVHTVNEGIGRRVIRGG